MNFIKSWIYSNLTETWFSLNQIKDDKITKMEPTLFVSSKLTFSKYLWCLNFPPTITKQVERNDFFWTNLFWDTLPTRSGKYKHHEYSENVNFGETNNVVSILVKVMGFILYFGSLNSQTIIYKVWIEVILQQYWINWNNSCIVLKVFQSRAIVDNWL